jgi:tetratricopeptide (TPR) repeat protein
MTETGTRRGAWALALILAAAVLAAYWQAPRNAFVNYDDQDYVERNVAIQKGVTWDCVKWAFTTGHACNWHPITRISHAIDFQFYGMDAAGHHLTSVFLHITNSVLLLLLLNKMTGALWRSALVAALFALHPLRVESVAWVSERKDVLSGFFWMLTISAYFHYTEGSKAGSPKRGWYYAAALVLFALGLMAKPMVVTLPCVLLLLDYWPLRRGLRIVEKIPFLLLTLCSSIVTFEVQNRAGVVATLGKFSIGDRLANVPVAYARYMGKSFWPSGLAAFYPTMQWPVVEVIGAVVLLAAVTGVSLWRVREQPYLAVGWFWFLGVLVPTIGLVQVGDASISDRYTYLPSVGLWIMVVWGLSDLVANRPPLRLTAIVSSGLALGACAVLTFRQVGYWKDTITLFSHAAAASKQNYLAYYNIGCEVMGLGNYPRAIRCYLLSLENSPSRVSREIRCRTFNNLGYSYLHQGQVSNAVVALERAVALMPRFPEAYYTLGRAFMTNHQPDVAVESFQKALAQDPTVPEIQYGLGEALLETGRAQEAQGHLEQALQSRPGWSEAHYKLANALVQTGQLRQAIAHYEQALKLRPGYDQAANNLAWLLATSTAPGVRDGTRALELARQADEHSGGKNPVIAGTLAAAYAETGRFSEAAAAAERARQLAVAQTNSFLAEALEAQLRQYQAGHPFHE